MSLDDDLRCLPRRLTTSEVLGITRLSRTTLWRRVRSGQFPSPVERARSSLFSTDEVIRVLRTGGRRIGSRARPALNALEISSHYAERTRNALARVKGAKS